MPKYRTTQCQDEGFSKGMWYYAPIDLRKRFYFCDLCQGHHLVKEGVVFEKAVKPPPGAVKALKDFELRNVNDN